MSTAQMPAVTAAMEDYLTRIYRLRELGGTVTTQMIAESLHVTSASVTGMVKRLVESRFVHHLRYQGVDLTDEGEQLALAVIRRHRLIERFLVETLGYPWESVHVEADRLEHHVSAELASRLEQVLGFPSRDPHGAPIPDRDGHMTPQPTVPLTDLHPGDHVRVVRVSHRDPSRLRYLSELGLRPGADVTLIERLPFDGPVRLLVEGSERLVGGPLVDGLHVAPLPG